MPESSEDKVLQLVRLQSFDGSFPVSPQLVQILGRTALSRATEFHVIGTVWATVLAIAYLQKNLIGQPELLEGLVEKAMDFVSQIPGVDCDALLERAKGLML